MDIHLYMHCILNTLTILILYKEYSKQSFKFSMESWALHGKYKQINIKIDRPANDTGSSDNIQLSKIYLLFICHRT